MRYRLTQMMVILQPQLLAQVEQQLAAQETFLRLAQLVLLLLPGVFLASVQPGGRVVALAVLEEPSSDFLATERLLAQLVLLG